MYASPSPDQFPVLAPKERIQKIEAELNGSFRKTSSTKFGDVTINTLQNGYDISIFVAGGNNSWHNFKLDSSGAVTYSVKRVAIGCLLKDFGPSDPKFLDRALNCF